MQYKIKGIKSANRIEEKSIYIFEKRTNIRQLEGNRKEGREVISRLKANLYSQSCIGRSKVNILSNLPISPLKFY